MQKRTSKDMITLPAMLIPGFRTLRAHDHGVGNKLLIENLYGGLGDEICTEPTLRYILNNFTDCEVSLAAMRPYLFGHLKFKKVYDLRKDKSEWPNWDNYFTVKTMVQPSSVVWQFFSHMITNCLDFPAMCAIRRQLPLAEREVQLHPSEPEQLLKFPERSVFIHPGKHWPSKTFPADFWNAVTAEIISQNAVPVLIGGAVNAPRGTVDVDPSCCIDLRNKLKINDTIWYLHRAKVLLTNDSSPIHMAAPGNAWVGFVAAPKHADYIMHWRKGQWAWRQQDFSRGGLWDQFKGNPNSLTDERVEECSEELLRSFLPDPKEFARWAVSKLEFSHDSTIKEIPRLVQSS